MKKGLAVLLMGLALVMLLAGCGCKHENTEIQNAADATCTTDGYTGDTYCLDCKKVIKKGETIAATGHTEGSPVNAYDATCTYQGFTGNVFCTVCGEQLSEGTYTDMLPHTPMTERSYVSEATCAHDGYTGDIVCSVCYEVLDVGERTPALDHVPGERENVREATCTDEGYTGDIYCQNCGTRLEEGEWLPVIDHALGDPENVVEAACNRIGYTGDRTCTMCGEVFSGESVPATEHSYGDDGLCASCGYRVPGLYIDGKLSMDWDTLVNEGYAVMEEDTLTSLQEALYGMIVVSDDVKEIRYDIFYECNFSEIWIPWSVENGDDLTFYSSKTLETVRLFCPLSQTPRFDYCSALKQVDLPDGIEVVSWFSFDECTSLTEITLPDSVKRIDESAFVGCTSLSEINFPEGLEAIGYSAFCGTAIREFIAPASLNGLDSYVFADCASLVKVDLSACTVTEIPTGAFENCAAMSEITLPATLTTLDGGFNNCSSLKTLVLPEGVTYASAHFNGCTSLETLVWPTSLKEVSSDFLDGEDLASHLTILYRGDQLRWSLINGVDHLSEFKVTMDYQD